MDNRLTSDVMLELHVPCFETVKEFYGSLGFDVVWEKKPEARKGYLVMRRDDSILNFYCGNEQVCEQSYFKRFPNDTVRGYGMEIIIPIDNIDDFYKTVSLKYVDKIVGKLEQRFNHLDFRMIDPFGFYLRFVERHDWVHNRDEQGNKSV
jgi:hypothetical protein